MTSYIVFGSIVDGLLDIAERIQADADFLAEALEAITQSDEPLNVVYVHPSITYL